MSDPLKVRAEAWVVRIGDSAPTARPLFRVLAGVFAAAALVAAASMIRGLRLGHAQTQSLSSGDLVVFVLIALFTLAMAWVAVTGRVPSRLYEIIKRPQ